MYGNSLPSSYIPHQVDAIQLIHNIVLLHVQYIIIILSPNKGRIHKSLIHGELYYCSVWNTEEPHVKEIKTTG